MGVVGEVVALFNNQKLIPEFVIEGKAHVEKIEAGLLEVERGYEDAASINIIFRSAHSIKGTAGFFGFNKIVELAHAMENLLEKIRNDEIKITLKIVDGLLAANDKLKEMIENVTDSDNVNTAPYIHRLNDILSEAQANKNAGVDGTYERLISAAKKHGQRLYKLSVDFAKGTDCGRRRTEIAGNIRLIGNMIADSLCKGSKNSDDTGAVFLFSTVLEKDLIMMGLDLCETTTIILEEAKQEDFVQFTLAEQGGQGYPEKMPSAVKEFVLKQGGEEFCCIADQVPGRDEIRYTCNIKEEDRIRVNVALLDNLVNLSSELVLGRNQLLRILENHVEDIPGLSGVLQNIDYITSELQEKVMRTRMQPLTNVFDKMPRFVRELSKSIEKKVALHMEGGGVELDKSIIEGLADPLTHLVRNALDHGIEVSEIREALKKPEVATLGIKAYHEGGRVVIDIIDDGAGINVEKIKHKALGQGLISRERIAGMNESDVLNLIFLPGFSTAEQVTDISGRGVGLDVAKSNIEKLGGTVEVHTAWGIGTTFRLILPLTLAIIPSIIVEVSEYRFALPQISIQEIVRIRAGDNLRKIEFLQGQRVLRLRGKLLPVISLVDVCGIPTLNKADTGITKVIILKSSHQVFGLAVDAIHDREEILVKPLPRYLKESKGYSGVTILGDGKITMVLDVDGIAAAAKFAFVKEREVQQTASEEAVSRMAVEKQEMLLFKCSGPEVFGLNLSLVARVDEIDPGQIELIGDDEYINYRGNVLRLVRPEDFLPVSRTKTTQEKLCIIIPKAAKYPMAILAEKIQDTMEDVVKIQGEEAMAKGILGSTILNNRIVLLVNLHELFELVNMGRLCRKGGQA